MRTWSGMVELCDGDTALGPVHADLCAEPVGDGDEWWGELRGAARFGLGEDADLKLRLPDGQEGAARYAGTDPTDVYHRIEITGRGAPPF